MTAWKTGSCPIQVEINDSEYTMTLEYTYYPGDPGYTSGLPEHCYPPEPPEYEYNKLIYEGKDMEQILELLSSETLQEAIDDYLEQIAADY